MVEIRAHRREPLGKRFVDLPLGIGTPSIQASGRHGEDRVQVIRIAREPLESSRVQQTVQQFLGVTFPHCCGRRFGALRSRAVG